jgi:hypothetical protein
LGLHDNEEQIALPGEVLGQRLGDLVGGREVDESIRVIDRCSREHARCLGRTPLRHGRDLENLGHGHRSTIAQVAASCRVELTRVVLLTVPYTVMIASV